MEHGRALPFFDQIWYEDGDNGLYLARKDYVNGRRKEAEASVVNSFGMSTNTAAEFPITCESFSCPSGD